MDATRWPSDGQRRPASTTAWAKARGASWGRYEHRVIEGGVGHNLPQEAPRAFVQAVVDAGRL